MEETTIYYQWPDGAVAERTVSGGAETVTPPEGAVEITEEEYRAALATMEEEREREREKQKETEDAAIREDYEALRALGVPEETARRLSGYTGTDDPEVS